MQLQAREGANPLEPVGQSPGSSVGRLRAPGGVRVARGVACDARGVLSTPTQTSSRSLSRLCPTGSYGQSAGLTISVDSQVWVLSAEQASVPPMPMAESLLPESPQSWSSSAPPQR